ncbi:MAG: hypothetical protein Q7V31_16865 [Parvibaculum sp.]|uniref:hypothetical protein n=1 Tax=Parvibaculum sp. TaxID=2024848 RepID=UPI0027257C1B|nr:hypothetical protein [Parvibaculum sp.]MDO8840585.1 hypothetical protein [Parvibaculum sp.]
MSPAKNVGAPPELERAVKAQTAPEEMARIHFFHGVYDSPAMIFGPMSNKQPADLIANGTVQGGINKGQVLVIDLDPQEYDFSWGERVGDGHGLVSNKLTIRLMPGDLIYLRADIRPSMGAAFGIVGALADPPRAILVRCAPEECASQIGALQIVVAN